MNEKQKINIFMFEKIRQQVLKFLQCFDQFICRHYQTNINLDFYFVFACVFVFFIFFIICAQTLMKILKIKLNFCQFQIFILAIVTSNKLYFRSLHENF